MSESLGGCREPISVLDRPLRSATRWETLLNRLGIFATVQVSAESPVWARGRGPEKEGATQLGFWGHPLIWGELNLRCGGATTSASRGRRLILHDPHRNRIRRPAWGAPHLP